jgi:voltage-gated potassium channel
MSFDSSNNPFTAFCSAIFTDSNTPARRIWQVLQGLLIVVSCLSMLLESFDAYREGFAGFISTIELTAIAFLTIDYLGNLAFSEERLRYVVSFWGVVDMLSVLPFFLLLLNPSSAVLVKSLRALRFLRLLLVWKITKGRLYN